MQGLHLTGDLFGCNCHQSLLIDLETLTRTCREATLDAGLTIVDEKFFLFPDVDGEPGGITGTVLLAESHLAIHTWPERNGVTLDVYVCNYMHDNSGKAQQLFDTLRNHFRPTKWHGESILRGDISDPEAGDEVNNQPSEMLLEWAGSDYAFGARSSRQVASFQSDYQRVDVHDTASFGRLFRLDGRFMTSEKDEFVYHECMVHPAALSHPAPQRALVIGGGDGGSSEELLKHPSMERVVMAELDGAVVEMAREHLGKIHRGVFDDPRLDVRIGDGLAFVKETDETFDLIVLDLTDPDTPAQRLYTADFFRLCQRILRPGGAVTLHIGSPYFDPTTVKRLTRELNQVFAVVRPMTAYVPLYGSLWAMALASDTLDPLTLDRDVIAHRLAERDIGNLDYYHADLHHALFALPGYVRRLVDPQNA